MGELWATVGRSGLLSTSRSLLLSSRCLGTTISSLIMSASLWEDVPFPTLLPPPSIKSPALINAFPAISPADRVPASTKPSTEFHRMFWMKPAILHILDEMLQLTSERLQRTSKIELAMMLRDARLRHTGSTLFPAWDPRYRSHDDVSVARSETWVRRIGGGSCREWNTRLSIFVGAMFECLVGHPVGRWKSTA